ncbi:MAG: peptide deformylase 1 [Chloroflexota bacterium]|nr:MAG: peptide deformylase 1 [Chloroflexota bacterium]
MALLTIIYPDNPILRRKAHRVTTFDSRLQKLAQDMAETMRAAPGVGLAAPQVAVSQRLIVVRLPDDDDSRKEFGEQAGVLYTVVNPEIVKASKEMVEGVEACLSIPGYFGTVERYESVVVKGQDIKGKALRLRASGWLARVFQHEIDHLDGRLYIDIASEVWEAGADDEDEEQPLAE